MKHLTLFIVAASVILAFAGCAKRSASNPKVADLGVVDLSDGTLSHYYLGGGRICFISPTVFTNGLVKLGISIQDTNSANVLLTVGVETIIGRPVEVGNDKVGVSLTPQVKP